MLLDCQKCYSSKISGRTTHGHFCKSVPEVWFGCTSDEFQKHKDGEDSNPTQISKKHLERCFPEEFIFAKMHHFCEGDLDENEFVEVDAAGKEQVQKLQMMLSLSRERN